MRRLLQCVLGTVLLTSAAAGATPASCASALTDPAGDSRIAGTASGPAALDIRGLDVASGRTQLVVALRLVSTDVDRDVTVRTVGAEWRVELTIGGAPLVFTRSVPGNNGAPRTGVTIRDRAVPATFAIDGNAFVWRVSRSYLRKFTGKTSTLADLLVRTTMIGTTDVAPDDGQPARAPSDKARRCAKAS